jgi:HEAT repeat protein
VRALAVIWGLELLPTTDGVGQRALADLLLHLCHDVNVGVQRPAVQALGRVSDPRAFERLKHLLRHASPPVRAAAAQALAQQALARLPKPGEGEPDARAVEMLRQVVPLLQKALEDPALEVVVAAAENLGGLGVSEAGPVLTSLLHHPSESVRLTAAQALERIANPAVLDGLLQALEDSAVSVRFGVVGALGHVADDRALLSELQQAQLITRLEELLLRDADAGVRSRAATVLGQFAPPAELSFLWRRVLSREDNRVQEKAWAAMIEITVRSASLDLLRHWDRTLAESNQGTRRLQMLGEVYDRWKKSDTARNLATPAAEALVQAQLDQGKWAAAFPLVHDLLTRNGTDADVERRLRWLLAIGNRALADGNPTDALRTVREAQPFLPRSNGLAPDFEKLERRAKP